MTIKKFSAKYFGLSLILLLIPALHVFAQDPAVTNPEFYSVKLENEYVRVLELVLPPGGKDVMHSHPKSFIYHITDGKLRVTNSDGTVRSVDLIAGKSFWQDAVTHSIENIGDTTIKLVGFEIRKQVGNGWHVEHDPATVAPDANKVIFENDSVRVVETITKPGGGGELHSHVSMAVYCVSPANLEITAEDGTSRVVDLPAGAAIWSPPVTHSVKNIGQNISHLLHLEIK